MEYIKLSTKSSRQEVKEFLEELSGILNKRDFNIDSDIVVIRKKKDKNNEIYSTPYTLLDLDYNIWDVVKVLRKLMIEDYSETLFDKDDINPPLLFVFGKFVNKKLVYIKLKIKEVQQKYLLCVSFHYAKEKMQFPYA